MTLIYLAASLLLMVVLFVICAPGFLFTEDVTRKSDAVVLFVGPGNEARLYEARQLVKDGYARYLLIPSSGEVYTQDSTGELVKLKGKQPCADFVHKTRIAATYKKHFENTHKEALEARRMMDERGLCSALLVSSAYHMRRIRIIAWRVFDENNYTITCNPAQWQREFTAADWLDTERRQIIVSEYVKIGWFLVYGVFG